MQGQLVSLRLFDRHADLQDIPLGFPRAACTLAWTWWVEEEMPKSHDEVPRPLLKGCSGIGSSTWEASEVGHCVTAVPD